MNKSIEATIRDYISDLVTALDDGLPAFADQIQDKLISHLSEYMDKRAKYEKHLFSCELNDEHLYSRKPICTCGKDDE